MENILQIILVSIIQGITEFIPVSSSAHVNLLSKIFGYQDIELVINVSAHFGSLIAVIFSLKEKFLNLLKNKSLFFKIIIASIPLGFVGFFLIKYGLISNLRTLEVIGWTTIIFGLLLYVSDKFNIKYNIKNSFTIKSAIVGLFQIAC